MSKTYRPYDPNQQLLLPAALREWLPDDHPAYFISGVVDQLELSELSEITARYERESRGGPPYHPRMMVEVLPHGYCVGVASSRRIAQRLHEDTAFRVLVANNRPDVRTISDFRKDNLEALSGLFLQVLALCRQAGLVKLGHVALDGTKVRANASRHKAMSYGRMKENEAQLAAEVEELLRRAHEVDDGEDRRYGQSKRGDELPQELAFREGRLRKIREAVAMVEEVIDNVGAVPKQVSADAGYYSAQAVDGLSRLGVDPFVAPEQTRHGRVVPPAPRGCIPSRLSPRDRMRRKLQTKRGRQRYALRMQTVEPVFGQIKQGRGFRQFLLRGLEKVSGEWSLICTGHNLLKLFRFGAAQPRETPTNRFAASVPNIVEVVGTVRRRKLLVRQWLHPATTIVAV